MTKFLFISTLLQVLPKQVDTTTVIITALITFATSLLTAYFTTLKTIRTEKDKINSNTQLAYSNKILDKRLEVYPQFYSLISDIAKKLFYDSCTFEDLQEFQKNLDALDSKYVIFFSSLSTAEMGNLRRLLRNIIKLKTYPLIDETKTHFFQALGNVENSLKQDIGIYIVEFDDPERKIDTYSYQNVNRQTELRRVKNKKRFSGIRKLFKILKRENRTN